MGAAGPNKLSSACPKIILKKLCRVDSSETWTPTNTMSRFNGPSVRPGFASKTTFDALEVDSGEETEEEVSELDSPVPDRFVIVFVVILMIYRVHQCIPGPS